MMDDNVAKAHADEEDGIADLKAKLSASEAGAADFRCLLEEARIYIGIDVSSRILKGRIDAALASPFGSAWVEAMRMAQDALAYTALQDRYFDTVKTRIKRANALAAIEKCLGGGACATWVLV